jgi:hypothetical protein
VALVLSLLVPVVVVGACIALGARLMRRNGSGPGRDVIVRCAAGHLYSTIWIPSVSLKAVRLGSRRYQRCPVGRHWAMTDLVDRATLSPAELEAALAVTDWRVP